MTGYYISVGYNSSFSADEVWDEFKRVGQEIANKPDAICLEASRVDDFGMAELKEYGEAFVQEQEDLTIRFKDADPNDEDSEPQIVMYASGGDPSRSLKESVRRAYIRLVLQEMHSKQMEINIQVG